MTKKKWKMLITNRRIRICGFIRSVFLDPLIIAGLIMSFEPSSVLRMWSAACASILADWPKVKWAGLTAGCWFSAAPHQTTGREWAPVWLLRWWKSEKRRLKTFGRSVSTDMSRLVYQGAALCWHADVKYVENYSLCCWNPLVYFFIWQTCWEWNCHQIQESSVSINYCYPVQSLWISLVSESDWKRKKPA